MNDSCAANLAVVLVHHPVMDKNGDTIAAAVTALDLHDIARASKTFGADAFYVVTPLEDQQTLVRQIVDHWVTGAGAKYNPDRRAALELIRLMPSLEDVREAVAANTGEEPRVVVTSARMENSDLSYTGLGEMVQTRRPVLLVFGTAWGLAQDLIDGADYRLAPINGQGEYNHLAVRSAVSIILDRVLGDKILNNHQHE
ncbi:MAG: RNA methyltransferase [Desulfobacteraceae bacterium]